MTGHFAKAEDSLEQLSLIKDYGVKALVACGHALLAVAEELNELRKDMDHRHQTRTDR